MFRPVLLASLGVLAIQPVFAQEATPAQMSSGTKPGSSIALSPFALAQRDQVRETTPVSKPTLQASTPTQTATQQTTPTAVVPTPTQPKPLAVTIPTPSAIPVALPQTTTTIPAQTVPAPIPTNSLIPSPQTTAKNIPVPAFSPKTGTVENSTTATKTVALPTSPAAQPKSLASREAMRQRMLLSQMDADLAAAQPRLDRAQARLSQSQRQLGAFTTTLRSAMMEAGDEGGGLHPFVRVAQRYLGTPYVWGGESARGFDCSGFIMRVMRDLGYRALPHSAAEQFHYGTPIARELLKPGDIVFFANTYKPGVSHVGIYLGRGRFIHAANSKVGTIVSSLNESKWIAHYAGARRLVRAKA
ncbi:hypothetical protein EON83_11805 [bacterium]|nr:MAG: hypothetical protein EON83_11805 [bacterium]